MSISVGAARQSKVKNGNTGKDKSKIKCQKSNLGMQKCRMQVKNGVKSKTDMESLNKKIFFKIYNKRNRILSIAS